MAQHQTNNCTLYTRPTPDANQIRVEVADAFTRTPCKSVHGEPNFQKMLSEMISSVLAQPQLPPQKVIDAMKDSSFIERGDMRLASGWGHPKQATSLSTHSDTVALGDHDAISLLFGMPRVSGVGFKASDSCSQSKWQQRKDSGVFFHALASPQSSSTRCSMSSSLSANSTLTAPMSENQILEIPTKKKDLLTTSSTILEGKASDTECIRESTRTSLRCNHGDVNANACNLYTSSEPRNSSPNTRKMASVTLLPPGSIRLSSESSEPRSQCKKPRIAAAIERTSSSRQHQFSENLYDLNGPMAYQRLQSAAKAPHRCPSRCNSNQGIASQHRNALNHTSPCSQTSFYEGGLDPQNQNLSESKRQRERQPLVACETKPPFKYHTRVSLSNPHLNITPSETPISHSQRVLEPLPKYPPRRGASFLSDNSDDSIRSRRSALSMRLELLSRCDNSTPIIFYQKDKGKNLGKTLSAASVLEHFADTNPRRNRYKNKRQICPCTVLRSSVHPKEILHKEQRCKSAMSWPSDSDSCSIRPQRRCVLSSRSQSVKLSASMDRRVSLQDDASVRALSTSSSDNNRQSQSVQTSFTHKVNCSNPKYMSNRRCHDKLSNSKRRPVNYRVQSIDDSLTPLPVGRLLSKSSKGKGSVKIRHEMADNGVRDHKPRSHHRPSTLNHDNRSRLPPSGGNGLACLKRLILNSGHCILSVVVGPVDVRHSLTQEPLYLPFPWILCNRCLPGMCMRTKDSRHFWSQVLVWSTLGGLLIVTIIGIVTIFFLYVNSLDTDLVPEGTFLAVQPPLRTAQYVRPSWPLYKPL